MAGVEREIAKYMLRNRISIGYEQRNGNGTFFFAHHTDSDVRGIGDLTFKIGTGQVQTGIVKGLAGLFQSEPINDFEKDFITPLKKLLKYENGDYQRNTFTIIRAASDKIENS